LCWFTSADLGGRESNASDRAFDSASRDAATGYRTQSDVDHQQHLHSIHIADSSTDTHLADLAAREEVRAERQRAVDAKSGRGMIDRLTGSGNTSDIFMPSEFHAEQAPRPAPLQEAKQEESKQTAQHRPASSVHQPIASDTSAHVDRREREQRGIPHPGGTRGFLDPRPRVAAAAVATAPAE
jgi:hypothetical protein